MEVAKGVDKVLGGGWVWLGGGAMRLIGGEGEFKKIYKKMNAL